ncbi:MULTISPECIES: helix-turn-helix transcriptional regulator [Castellaniella]|uniref:helix-turn-helix domain-containing protein n=1 Tax=Castellaniella TaxID=359336 RepID=UPI002D7F3E16|nr:helix-turn-helix transcriptional regulator [Castellaniella sp.]HET8702227.1 helix-turn-helix transcriptional regulator [Castellaniella sp.]
MDSNNFGQWVRARRLARGWTGQQLARRAGLSQSCISMIELGVRCPTLDTATRIARALGADLWEALREIQDPA